MPTSLIKTAQTAEWKMQAWKLGKPPSLAYAGIGFDVKTATGETNSISAQSAATSVTTPDSDHSRPSINSSEYDDLADFNGQFGHDGFAGKMGNHRLAKKPSKGSFLGLFEGKPKPKRRTSLTRPSATRTDSLYSLDGSVLSKQEKTLRSSKSKSSLKSARAQSISSKVEPTLPPIPAPEYSPVRLEFDILTLIEGSTGTLRSKKKSSTPASDDTPTLDRASGKRSLSLSPRGTTLKSGGGSLPPLPPLPTFAAIRDNGPPSPSFSTMSTPTPQTRHPSFSTQSLACGATTSSAGFSILTAQKGHQKSSGPSLASAILSASHAEALKGGSADLMAILERGDSRPWGFSYTDVNQPVKVWCGDRDDRIGIGSVRWMERTMKDCTLKILKGEGHGLLTNADVVVEVLESVAKEWSR